MVWWGGVGSFGGWQGDGRGMGGPWVGGWILNKMGDARWEMFPLFWMGTGWIDMRGKVKTSSGLADGETNEREELIS